MNSYSQSNSGINFDELIFMVNVDQQFIDEFLQTVDKQNFVQQIYSELKGDKLEDENDSQTQILNIQILVNLAQLKLKPEYFSQISEAKEHIDLINKAWQTIYILREQINSKNYLICRDAFVDLIEVMKILNRLFSKFQNLLVQLKKDKESIPAQPQKVEEPTKKIPEVKEVVEQKQEEPVVTPKVIPALVLPSYTTSKVRSYTLDEFLDDCEEQLTNIVLPGNEAKYKRFLEAPQSLKRIKEKLVYIQCNLQTLKPKLQEEDKLRRVDEVLKSAEDKLKVVEKLRHFARTNNPQIEIKETTGLDEVSQTQETRVLEQTTKVIKPKDQVQGTEAVIVPSKHNVFKHTVPVNGEAKKHETPILKRLKALDRDLGIIRTELDTCKKRVLSALDFSKRVQQLKALDTLFEKLTTTHSEFAGIRTIQILKDEMLQLQAIYFEIDNLRNITAGAIDKFIMCRIGREGTKRDYLNWLNYLIDLGILNNNKNEEFAAYLLSKDSHLLAKERHFFRLNSYSIQTKSMHEAIGLLLGHKINNADKPDQRLTDVTISQLTIDVKGTGNNPTKTHVLSRHSIRIG